MDTAPDTELAAESPQQPQPPAKSNSGSTPYAIYRPVLGIFEDDWRASVSPTRPWPVILLHGTGQVKGVWEALGRELRQDGWAVFAPDFGTRATQSLKDSIEMLLPYIEAVLHATGAKKAIIAGHSQGGLLATLLSLRIALRTRHVVCLAAPNHGTNPVGIASGFFSRVPATRSLVSSFVQSYWGVSGLEQFRGSKMVLSADQGDVLAPGVSYTCVATKFDQLVRPPRSCFLDDGGKGVVENLYVQDEYPPAVILHEQMTSDWRVRAIVRRALFALVGEAFELPTQSRSS